MSPGIDPAEVAAARRAAVVRVQARQLGEIGAAADDALAQVVQPARAPRSRTRPRWCGSGCGARASAAPARRRPPAPRRSISLRMWKPLGLRSDVADLARACMLASALDEKLGQPVVAAPAEGAALQRVGRVGIAGGDAGAKSAPPLASASAFSARARAPPRCCSGLACSGTRTRMCARLYSSRVAGARLQLARGIGVDLAVAHLDLVRRPRARAGASAGSGRAGPRGSVRTRRRRARARSRKSASVMLVVLGDALHRAVELQLVDAHAGFRAELQLRLVDDQALEHLALEHSRVGRRRALAPQLALGARRRASSSSEPVITSLFTTATMRSTSDDALAPARRRAAASSSRRAAAIAASSEHLLERQRAAEALGGASAGVARVGHRSSRRRLASAARSASWCRSGRRR